MTISSKIRARVFSFAAWIVVSLWTHTLRVRILRSAGADQLEADRMNCIYAFWHRSMFLLLGATGTSDVLIPVSESRDGEIMASLLKRFGLGIIRGSSGRNGHKALLAMTSGVRRGLSVGIAVDGPRGPLYQAKKGAVFLAAKMKVPIVPVATASKRFLILPGTWEKLMLPSPFTDCVVLFGDPLRVEGTSDEEVEKNRKRLESRLRALTQQAQEHAGVPSFPACGAFDDFGIDPDRKTLFGK